MLLPEEKRRFRSDLKHVPALREAQPPEEDVGLLQALPHVASWGGYQLEGVGGCPFP